MQQKQRRPSAHRLGLANDGDCLRPEAGKQRHRSLQDGVGLYRCLSGSVDGKNGVACRLAVLRVMMRGILRVVMCVGREHRAYRQLTGVPQDGEQDQEQRQRRRDPGDHAVTVAAARRFVKAAPARSPGPVRGVGITS